MEFPYENNQNRSNSFCISVNVFKLITTTKSSNTFIVIIVVTTTICSILLNYCCRHHDFDQRLVLGRSSALRICFFSPDPRPILSCYLPASSSCTITLLTSWNRRYFFCTHLSIKWVSSSLQCFPLVLLLTASLVWHSSRLFWMSVMSEVINYVHIPYILYV